jgi:hypothetical protein
LLADSHKLLKQPRAKEIGRCQSCCNLIDHPMPGCRNSIGRAMCDTLLPLMSMTLHTGCCNFVLLLTIAVLKLVYYLDGWGASDNLVGPPCSCHAGWLQDLVERFLSKAMLSLFDCARRLRHHLLILRTHVICGTTLS